MSKCANEDEVLAARIAWMDSFGMVNDVFNLPDAPGNRELFTMANRNYLKASEDLMAVWDGMETESPS